jgi:DNA-binding NarL/FixJ family response regulator
VLALRVREGEAGLTHLCGFADESYERAHPIAMPSSSHITVVIARFDDLLGRGLRQLIESDPSLAIVASDVEHARIPVVLRAHRPDVAILDAGALERPAQVRELSDSHPATRLILLTSAANGAMALESAQLLAFGASACLGGDTQSRDVLNAIHLASRGLHVIPRQARAAGAGPLAGGELLTPREAEVLALLRNGRSNAQIALVLQMGVETVRTHARNIYRKLGVSSRRELTALPAIESQSPPPQAERSPRERKLPLPVRARRRDGLHHA